MNIVFSTIFPVFANQFLGGALRRFRLIGSPFLETFSSQLQSDVHLATETVALSTVFAFGSLSTVMFLMA
ncbi:MAG: hypothetical protein DRH20_09550 [Deltaproteobacteria bacterium]|nr:MAG: hypothetical protein DRH20_09550 [Deltaproteobacteria bacterium]